MAIKSFVQYLSQVRYELSRVEWPSFQEFVGSTIIVLFLVAVFALYLGAVDAALVRSARYIFKLFAGY